MPLYYLLLVVRYPLKKVEAGSVANGKLAAGDNNLVSVSGLTGTAKK